MRIDDSPAGENPHTHMFNSVHESGRFPLASNEPINGHMSEFIRDLYFTRAHVCVSYKCQTRRNNV